MERSIRSRREGLGVTKHERTRSAGVSEMACFLFSGGSAWTPASATARCNGTNSLPLHEKRARHAPGARVSWHWRVGAASFPRSRSRSGSKRVLGATNSSPGPAPASSSSSPAFPVRLAVGAIMLGVMNRMLYKMQLVPLKSFSVLLSLMAPVLYTSLYAAVMMVRIRQKKITAPMLAYAKRRKNSFVVIGLCEALSFTMQVFSAPHIPGSLLPVLAQAILLFSMLYSSLILHTRYDAIQLLGACGTVLGVILCTIPSLYSSAASASVGTVISADVMKYSVIYALSMAFLAMAVTLKDRAFRMADLRLDVFVVNTCASFSQLLASLALLPLTLRVATSLSLHELVSGGFDVLSGSTSPYMPWLTLGYFSVNLAFNVTSLKLMREASAVQALLVGLVTVPLSALARQGSSRVRNGSSYSLLCGRVSWLPM
ncbi:Protein CLT3, chloroplastic [Porphyridium purpureum]|uniref:Protein CLT3, chloroplastic n=1 Tax=Porphyridium purpureum TaxID=35688 RepID=A0A5J4YUR1_PORPP|nr:Protein CLT3, chloroplastic [Porphyridium purpureum]|eukprot:POR9330..scf227_4